MDITTLVLAGISLLMLGFAIWQGGGKAVQGLRLAFDTFWRNLPMLLIGFLIAGLAQILIPREIINEWLGSQTGAKSVLIASVLGGIVPGSPYSTFPIVAFLYNAGASLASVVSFVTAWALWSVTRLPVEMALIEPRAALIRFAITFLMPPAAGFIALALDKYL